MATVNNARPPLKHQRWWLILWYVFLWIEMIFGGMVSLVLAIGGFTKEEFYHPILGGVGCIVCPILFIFGLRLGGAWERLGEEKRKAWKEKKVWQ